MNNWQLIRWRVAGHIRDRLESRNGMWTATLFAVVLFAVVLFAVAVFAQRANRLDLVVGYVLDLIMLGIAILGCAWQEDGDTREARRHRTYVKLCALGSIAVSAGFIINRFFN